MQVKKYPVQNYFFSSKKKNMQKGELDRDKLRNLIEESGLSMSRLGIKAKLSDGYLKQLVSGKLKSPTIENFLKVTDALEVYPGALIPLEWNAPESTFDEQLMRSVMKDAMKIYVERHKICNLDLNWYYDMVIAAYKKFSKDKMPVNDNTVYIWLDGKLDNLKQG